MTQRQATQKRLFAATSPFLFPPLRHITSSPRVHYVYEWMHLKYEWVLQQWGKRKGDQPAHVERDGCSLMWLQLGSLGPNEVLWSSAVPSPAACTPTARAAAAAPFRIIKKMRANSSGDLKERGTNPNRPPDWHMSLSEVRTMLQLPAATSLNRHTETLTQNIRITVQHVKIT